MLCTSWCGYLHKEYQPRTNEKYYIFLYLYVAKWPEPYSGLYFSRLPKSQQVKYNICYTCYTFHINSILNIGPTSMHTIQSTKSKKKLSRRKEKKRQKNDIRCHQVDVRGYCQAYDED